VTRSEGATVGAPSLIATGEFCADCPPAVMRDRGHVNETVPERSLRLPVKPLTLRRGVQAA